MEGDNIVEQNCPSKIVTEKALGTGENYAETACILFIVCKEKTHSLL